jgi:hypothetical protein
MKLHFYLRIGLVVLFVFLLTSLVSSHNYRSSYERNNKYDNEVFSNTPYNYERTFNNENQGLITRDYTYSNSDRNYYGRHYNPQPGQYIKYSTYMRTYEVVDCYNHPPRGKLFYIKCP